MEKSQTNFMVLVQNLLKSPTERKRFFKVSSSVLLLQKASVLHAEHRHMSAGSPAAVPLILTALSPQEVFPVQYGTKFDTALQALTAGLVCKLEQLLPVPNLSQVCTGCFLFCFFESILMDSPKQTWTECRLPWGCRGVLK